MTTDRPLAEDLHKLALYGGPTELVDTARAISGRQKTVGRCIEVKFISDLASLYGKNTADCATSDTLARQFAKDIRDGKLDSDAQRKKTFKILRDHATARLEISNPD
jgi:hypothetical protein